MTLCPSSHYALPISELNLSLRTLNTLQGAGFKSVVDLAGVNATQLLSLRWVGQRAIDELEEGLADLGLELPFNRPIAQPMVSVLDKDLATATCDETRVDQDLRWCSLVRQRLQAQPHNPETQRLLVELMAFTHEHHSRLDQRLDQLIQLQVIGAALGGEAADDHGRWLAERLQRQLLQRYGDTMACAKEATTWLGQLLKLINRPGAVEALRQWCRGNGKASSTPPASRKLAELIGCQPRSLQADRQAHVTQQKPPLPLQHHEVEHWLQALGRLPFHSDDANLWMHGPQAAVARQSLAQRLDLYKQYGIAIPDAEWALHCQVIDTGMESVGSGYWQNPESLHQFLHRYAALIGAPGRMPKQKQLPDRVKGAVERHGGQGPVAKAAGLRYQGQLVGEGGSRTYWNDLRLRQLLLDAVRFHDLAPGAMPSRPQIRDCMISGVYPHYLGKKPESAIAALCGHGILRWHQVSERFCRNTVEV